MKRSPLRRRQPLRRNTPLWSFNPERLERLRGQQFGPKADWIRSLPCATCGQRGPPRTLAM